jgi:dsDNA-binding SOS-regulon protein
VYGGLEQIYLEAWRTGVTLLLAQLKHQEKFVWTLEADQALAQLKDFLSKPPILTSPHKKEKLLLYLAATTHVVSTTIIVERQEDGHAYPVQRLVYFVSEVLSESKAR